MALITCTECGNQVSDKAATCPKCGAPVSASLNAIDPNTAKRFKHPKTGEIVNLDNAATFTLLFGCIYFLLRGIPTHAVISLVLAICTFGISWLIYPIFARKIVRNDVITKGWIAIE